MMLQQGIQSLQYPKLINLPYKTSKAKANKPFQNQISYHNASIPQCKEISFSGKIGRALQLAASGLIVALSVTCVTEAKGPQKEKPHFYSKSNQQMTPTKMAKLLSDSIEGLEKLSKDKLKKLAEDLTSTIKQLDLCDAILLENPRTGEIYAVLDNSDSKRYPSCKIKNDAKFPVEDDPQPHLKALKEQLLKLAQAGQLKLYSFSIDPENNQLQGPR